MTKDIAAFYTSLIISQVWFAVNQNTVGIAWLALSIIVLIFGDKK